MVTAKATEACVDSAGASTGTLAYAAKCYQGSPSAYLDRPIAGYVNFCPAMLDTAIDGFQTQVSTVCLERFALKLFALDCLP